MKDYLAMFAKKNVESAPYGTDKTDRTPQKGTCVSSVSSPQSTSAKKNASEADKEVRPNPNTHPKQYGEWAANQLLAQPSYPVGTELHRAWKVLRNGESFCSMVSNYCTQDEALKSARFHWPDADVVPVVTGERNSRNE